MYSPGSLIFFLEDNTLLENERVLEVKLGHFVVILTKEIGGVLFLFSSPLLEAVLM